MEQKSIDRRHDWCRDTDEKEIPRDRVARYIAFLPLFFFPGFRPGPGTVRGRRSPGERKRKGERERERGRTGVKKHFLYSNSISCDVTRALALQRTRYPKEKGSKYSGLPRIYSFSFRAIMPAVLFDVAAAARDRPGWTVMWNRVIIEYFVVCVRACVCVCVHACALLCIVAYLFIISFVYEYSLYSVVNRGLKSD